MLRYLCVLLALIAFADLQVAGQQIFWASEVVEFSSQRTEKLFSAQQVLGKPNTIPDMEFSTCAWMPANNGTNEYIEVAFENPVAARQLIVLQNIYSNIIQNVTVTDTTGKRIQVYVAPVNNKPVKGGSAFQHKLFLQGAPIDKVRIQLIPSNEAIPYQIDAIGLSESADPVTLRINDAVSNFAYSAEHLGTQVNSSSDEVTPVISPDGKTLYFDRKKHPLNTGPAKNDDIWYSELDYKFEWTPAKNIGPPLNNDNHNFLCSISSDGNRVLLGNNYNNKNSGQPGISISYKDENGWGTPQDLMIDNFTNKNEYNEFCMSADGNVLMMSIETDASFGLKDIYVSFQRKENIWSEPINIGNIINTAGNEMSPYLAADNITMYFSSNGWPGYGGQDIFITKRLDNTWLNWSEPVNLGSVINTNGWDAYYTVDAGGTFAYFTSNISSGSDLDIYRIRLPDSIKPEPVLLFHGNIFDKSTEKQINSKIYYNAIDNMGGSGSSYTTMHSEFGMYLLRGSKYLVYVSADGYYDQTAELDLTGAQSLLELRNDFYLIPKKQGTIIELNNIEFNANSSVLNTVSYSELYKVIEFMQNNPTLQIEIRGHTNGLCEENFCNALSERRAQAVAKYIIEQGISADRITYAGYGKKIPIADNDTPEGRQKNQRVEFMITKI